MMQPCWVQHCPLKVGSKASGVVETGVWTADKQPVAWFFSRKFDWVVQVILQHAIKAILVLSARKAVIRRQKLGWHFLLRR
jgi:hypothetical protein